MFNCILLRYVHSNLPFIKSEIFCSEVSFMSFYFSTMRQKVISPRTAILCIFLILVFTVTQFYHGRDYHVASFSKESHTTRRKACRIWPEWNASDRGNLRYDHYNTKAQVPSVGDSKILGNPMLCLKAESRLDAYRMSSSKDYDWNAVRWGKHSRLAFII